MPRDSEAEPPAVPRRPLVGRGPPAKPPRHRTRGGGGGRHRRLDSRRPATTIAPLASRHRRSSTPPSSAARPCGDGCVGAARFRASSGSRRRGTRTRREGDAGACWMAMMGFACAAAADWGAWRSSQSRRYCFSQRRACDHDGTSSSPAFEPGRENSPLSKPSKFWF